MDTYKPIDQWAEEDHPDFLANIRAHVRILCPDLSDEALYQITRGIMQMTRQEFEK